jgi:heptosyltransferase-1
MGDILHALPAVTALRLAHPDWQIGWVVEPRWKALLTAVDRDQRSEIRDQRKQNTEQESGIIRGSAQPVVDQLHFAATRKWGKRPLSLETIREVRALRSELRAAEYDAVIDFQGAIRSAFIGRMARGKRFIGEEQPRERPARWFFTERVKTFGSHVIEQDLELASALAQDSLPIVPPQLPVDTDAEAWCDTVLSSAQPVALINPGAGWGAKRWPVERYAAVADGLIHRGVRVVVNAGPGEEPLAEAIHTATGGKSTSLSPSIEQLIALTRRIAICIAGDTGPLHLACALGRPVVGIYGPTDPSRNGPYGTESVVLRSPLSRRDHSRHAEPEAAMLTIQPDDVLRAAFALLA